MALTTQDKIGIGQIGLQGLQGLLGGMDNSQEENEEQLRQDQFFRALLESLNNQGNIEQGIGAENFTRAQSFANANPLGQEQQYKKSNTLGLQGLEALSGRQLARGTPSLASNFTSRPGVRDAYSDANVDEAIRQRRIATAGLDPRAAQEIGGSGSDYASRLFGELQGSQNMRRDLGQQQYDMIGERSAQAAAEGRSKDDGPGFWKKLGGALLPIAGVAANFIPGVGPVAGMALSALGGAGGGALTGGAKGAMLGGVGGAAAGYGVNKAGLGNSMPKGAGFEGNSNILGPMASGIGFDGVAPPSGQFTPMMPNRSPVTAPTMGLGQPMPVSPQGSRQATGGLPSSFPPQLNVGFPSNIGDRSITGPQYGNRPPIQTALSAPPNRPMQAGMNMPQVSSGGSGFPNLNNTGNLAPSMPLVQSGLGGTQDVNRIMQTIGNADPNNQAGRASVASLLAQILGGGAMKLGGNLPTAVNPHAQIQFPQPPVRPVGGGQFPTPVGGGKVAPRKPKVKSTSRVKT
jgi:hypothetical protein